LEMVQYLSSFYGVPMTDLLDEFKMGKENASGPIGNPLAWERNPLRGKWESR